MNVTPLDRLSDVLLIEPRVYTDDRGFFLETLREERYSVHGVGDRFVQVNHSRSRRGVLRGLHFQHPDAQAKLVHVVRGEIFDVAVDLRVGSPTFGWWDGARLSESNHRQLYVPAGFAHGFVVISEIADVIYHCSAPYRPESDRTLAWDDPVVAVDWPVEEPVLSEKDLEGDDLETLRRSGDLPAYPG